MNVHVCRQHVCHHVLVRSLLAFCCVAASSFPASTGHADVFRFKDGRVIEGTVDPKHVKTVNVNGIPTTQWIVQIAREDFVIVRESELVHKGHEPVSDSERKYIEMLRKSPPQTAEDHVALAGQCGLMGLRDLKLAHYERAVELDPNHAVARAAAGYMKDENGRWQKKEVVMGERRGKVFVGRWRFPEDVRKETMMNQAEQALAPIRKKLNAWHKAASVGRSEQMKREAIANLRQINDPREVSIISEYFLATGRQQPPLDIRLMYVQILSRFPVGIPALTNASLNDPEDQVRAACLDALQRMNASGAVPSYLGPSGLGSKNNDMVNRAAKGIARFDYPAAVEPLIYALVTNHEEIQGGGNTSYNTNGGMSFGSKAEKKIVPKQNKEVLAALTKQTGQDFRYDKKRWLAWYASLYAAPAGDLRRDP
ncbi:MAG: hypothetical protein ACE361_06450 [Aureliella sp.]